MHLKRVSFLPDSYPDKDIYPFNLDIFRQSKAIDFQSNLTFLVGENGAGKSTLLHCISGLVGLRAGEIILSGKHIGRVPAQTRAGLGVGTCAQGRSNFAHLTVEENLRLAGFKLPRRELREPAQKPYEQICKNASLLPQRSGELL